jgi:hypothetical protein
MSEEIDSALERFLEPFGWEPDGPGQWVHDTPHGPAVLWHLVEVGDWRQFALEGGAVPRMATKQVLAENSRLFGPVKLVARTGRHTLCRADLPEEFAGLARERSVELTGAAGGSLTSQDPRHAWASAVTAVATGEFRGLCESSPPDEAVADRLGQAGWTTSLDDGCLNVHLHMPGLYRQVSVEIEDGLGAIVATDLLPLDGVKGSWRKAAVHLAHQANVRLPLVRYAIKQGTGPPVLRAEVHLGSAPVSGVWLPTALEAIETAVTLTARELQALRDRELAELVLAAEAAGLDP